jgi:hypothetical protein
MKPNAISKFLFPLLVIALFSGCTTVFQDFTPERIPQNPSGIYTFSFAANLSDASNRIDGSERARIVINGETFDMVRRDGASLVFTYDYRMPQGVAEARYYYELEYDYNAIGGMKTRTLYSTQEAKEVFRSRLINRYPIQLVNERGPVGAQIAIVGSGFSMQDVVFVGDQEALTTVHSSNSLEFTVPPMTPGGPYPVVLRTSSGDLSAGPFRVDPAGLSVQPPALSLASDETQFFIIEISGPAPTGGLPVDIRTDIPASVIIPEAVIPQGASTVNINVTGGVPGNGILLISAPGFQPVEVPVRVN